MKFGPWTGASASIDSYGIDGAAPFGHCTTRGGAKMSVTNSKDETATAADKQAGAAVPDTHPKAFWFIFWGEFAERSSYYGMRAILPLYMAEELLMPRDQANAWYF